MAWVSAPPGETPIFTLYILQDGKHAKMCQCPLTGNTHFYSVKGVMPWVNINVVSMPSHGQHSFLLYPLIRPYFIRISDPIFAGNSQNILKKTLFRGFTRMFTVCSYLKILLKFSNLLSIRFDYTIIIRELHH